MSLMPRGFRTGSGSATICNAASNGARRLGDGEQQALLVRRTCVPRLPLQVSPQLEGFELEISRTWETTEYYRTPIAL